MDGADLDLHYLRTRGGHEIDFLITREKRPHQLIEVKWKDDRLSPNFKKFLAKENPSRIQVVGELAQGKSYPGGERIEPAKNFLGGISWGRAGVLDLLLLLVMVPELSDIQVIIGNFVDNSMLVIDPSGPVACQVMS